MPARSGSVGSRWRIALRPWPRSERRLRRKLRRAVDRLRRPASPIARWSAGAVLTLALAALALRWPSRAPSLVPAAPGDAPAGPDVLLVTVCSLRADHVHAYGAPEAITPALDRLAQAGTRYDLAWAAANFTTASHASLLTGLLPAENGVTTFGEPLAAGVRTLPEILHLYGYSTAAFVAARGPMTFGGQDGLGRGFDHFVDGLGGPDALPQAVASWWRGAPHPTFALVHVRDAHQPYGPAPAGTDPRITAWQAAAFDPHGSAAPTSALTAALAADPSLREQLAAVYDVGVHAADTTVGHLLDAIDVYRPDLAAHTLVIVTGDHGEGLGEGGALGHGKRLDEPVLHVPLLVRYPSDTVPDAPDEVRTEVSLLDVLPTVLDLAGAARPAGLPGRSLLGLADVPPWAPDGADDRARPALAQAMAPGVEPFLRTVALTRDWALSDPRGSHGLVHRGPDGTWAPVDPDAQDAPPAAHQALARLSASLPAHAPVTALAPAVLSPEDVESLHRNGYW